MLISPRNSSTQNLSLQISEIPIGSEQPIHTHEPEQIYYIINGKGLMAIDEEDREVFPGDAVYIPGNAKHGIMEMRSWKISLQIRQYSAKNTKVHFGLPTHND
jgi:quercetin dioxygenase-like cupin family protein